MHNSINANNNFNNNHNKNNEKDNNNFNCFVLFYHILSHTNSINNLNKLCANGSDKSIYKGKSNIRKLKSNFVSSDKVVSTSSKRIFDCVVPNRTK